GGHRPEVFTRGHAGAGGEDDVARAEEQREGHETEGNQVETFQTSHGKCTTAEKMIRTVASRDRGNWPPARTTRSLLKRPFKKAASLTTSGHFRTFGWISGALHKHKGHP